MKKAQVLILSDSVCKNAVGGYATVLLSQKASKLIQNKHDGITNHRAALLGVLEGLEALKTPCSVVIKTDSQYVVNGITKSLSSWKENNWTRSNGQAVAHADLWDKMAELCQYHTVTAVRAVPQPRLVELANQSLVTA